MFRILAFLLKKIKLIVSDNLRNSENMFRISGSGAENVQKSSQYIGGLHIWCGSNTTPGYTTQICSALPQIVAIQLGVVCFVFLYFYTKFKPPFMAGTAQKGCHNIRILVINVSQSPDQGIFQGDLGYASSKQRSRESKEPVPPPPLSALLDILCQDMVIPDSWF